MQQTEPSLAGVFLKKTELVWSFGCVPPPVRLASLVEEGLLRTSGVILWHGNHVSNHKT
jgi:hypothetical protein